MAPSRSERRRRTSFNKDQGVLALIIEKQVPLSNLYTHGVFRIPGGGRYLEIKDSNGSVVRTVPLIEGEDFRLKLKLELDKLVGRGNRGRGGVFTDDKL